MAKSKQQKTDALEEAKGKFDSSKLVVLASYNDLPVSDIQELRKQLKEKDVFYKVIKKTILKLVAKDNIDETLVDGLRGNLALAYGPDEVEAAKILAKFAKDHEGIELHAGWLENDFIDKAKVEELSKLLGKEELLAKLVGSLNSPISGLVNVLDGNTRGLVTVLKAIADQKQ
jgi:large subunit ribosomal protein L10